MKQICSIAKRFFKLIASFWPLWLLFGLVLVLAKTEHFNGLKFLLITFVILFLSIPQNIVHGLIGARGSIRVFFCLFIGWSFAFSGIYYWGFFKNAVVTEYENQERLLFQSNTPQQRPIHDTIYIVGLYDSLGQRPFFINEKEVVETTTTKVTFGLVLRNTFMVSLTQQPSDFFNMAISQYEVEKENHVDLLEWFLIVQIFISWILFGVFISILYNKFRRES